MMMMMEAAMKSINENSWWHFWVQIRQFHLATQQGEPLGFNDICR